MEENANNAQAPNEVKVVDKVLDVDIDQIVANESSSSIETKNYEGFRAKIEKVEVIETINKWNKPVLDDEGKVKNYEFNPDSTEMMQQVRVTTKPLPVLKANEDGSYSATEEIVTLGEGKFLTVNAKFNLTKDKEGKWNISKHPKAKLWKFMRKLDASKLSEIKEKFATITLSEPDKDDKQWLRIVC